MRKHLLTLAVAASAMMATAQDNSLGDLTVDFQLRTRGEYNNGVGSPRNEGELSNLSINDRARLGITWARQGLSVRLAGQQSGFWGGEGIKDQQTQFGIHEAWAKLQSASGYFLQVGRQTLVYDDERLLGGLDWHVVGNHHDALRMGYAGKADQLHLILAYNNNGAARDGNYYDAKMPYKTMQTLWYHHNFQAPLQMSLLLMSLGREAGEAGCGNTRYLFTYGTYLTYKPTADWAFNATLYAQTGQAATGASKRAWMANFDARYSYGAGYSTLLGVDVLSGAAAGDTHSTNFEPLYGTHHKFYGAMDYFYANSWKNGNPGLIDIKLTEGLKFSPKVNGTVALHEFLTARDYKDRLDLDRTLGTECDLQLNWAIQKNVTLQMGYSMMFGTKALDYWKGGSHDSWQDWGWISLNINPQIFSTKK